MLTLCGFSASNYYNKVKLALLEKRRALSGTACLGGQTDLTAFPGQGAYLLTLRASLRIRSDC